MTKLMGLIVKYSFVVLLFCCLYFPNSTYASLEAKTLVQALERREGVYEKDMYTNIHVPEIQGVLEKWCEEGSMRKTKSIMEKFDQVMDKRYRLKSDAEILLDSWSLYNRLELLQQKKGDTYTGDKYCRIKYILAGLQQYLRSTNVAILEDSSIVNDFSGGTDGLFGFAIKKDTLDHHLRQRNKYLTKLPETLNFTISNPELLRGLDGERKVLLQKSEQLMKAMAAYVLYDLKKEGIIDGKDIAMINKNIILEYANVCNVFHGRYEVKETLDSKGNHISYETNSLTLKINLCTKYFPLRDLPDIFKRIITHELGHHVYYFKDSKRKSFENICWVGETTMNAVCDDNDFVTAYAKTAAVEDYAEHFMHWFLDRVPQGGSKLDIKSTHFDSAL